MRQPPYDTGKVKIGLAHEPPVRRDFTPEELRLQRVLLTPKRKRSYLSLIGYIGMLIVVGIAVLKAP